MDWSTNGRTFGENTSEREKDPKESTSYFGQHGRRGGNLTCV